MLERETEEVKRRIADSAERLRVMLPKLPAHQFANLLENEAAKPGNSIMSEMPIGVLIAEAVRRLRAGK